MTLRVHRGFHRIGIVLVVPVLLLGIGLAAHETWLQWTTKDPYAAFAEAYTLPSDSTNKYAAPGMSEPAARPVEVGPYYRANYTLASLALGIALALYVAARAIGWVLAGFLSPGR